VHLKNQKDFFSGLLFMALGLCFAWAASKLAVGNSARMGPGYFPLLLGALLTLLGGFIVFKALVFETEDGGRIGVWAWRPLLCIVLAHGVFGVLIGGLAPLGFAPMGLVASIFCLSVLAARASVAFRWKEAVLMGLLMAALGYLVLAVLGLPWMAWPSPVGA
jgi:hypothetical protein